MISCVWRIFRFYICTFFSPFYGNDLHSLAFSSCLCFLCLGCYRARLLQSCFRTLLCPSLRESGRTSRNILAIAPQREAKKEKEKRDEEVDFTSLTKISAHLLSFFSPPLLRRTRLSLLSFLHHLGLLTSPLIKSWRIETWNSQRWKTWPLKKNRGKNTFREIKWLCSRVAYVDVVIEQKRQT